MVTNDSVRPHRLAGDSPSKTVYLTHMQILKSGSRNRLVFFLAIITLSFALLFFVTRALDERLALMASVAWATLLIIYLMYRWRSIPPIYDPQLIELRHLIELQSLMGGAFLPFSVWAMAPNDLFQLVSTIQIQRYGIIVECGSGVSTITIGRLLRQLGIGHLYSLEEDKAWYEMMVATLAAEGLTGVVTLIYAPLELYQGADAEWYALEQVRQVRAGAGHIDLLLVDGPKSVSTYSRYPALPVFVAQLDGSSLIVLDDTRRPGETAVLERWSREFQLRFEDQSDSPRGQAYIRLVKEL